MKPKKKQIKIGWTYFDWDILSKFPCRVFNDKARAQLAYGKNIVKVRQTVEEV